jgi:hypothetical protein
MDELQECDGDLMTKYLSMVYEKMSRFTTERDEVIEVCTRHDRGIISPGIIPHAKWTNIDRCDYRPGLNLTVGVDELPECDVLLSTAILHHTHRNDLPKVMAALCGSARRIVMLSGPNAAEMPELFGDHMYHIDGAEITGLAQDNGFRYRHASRSGLSEPLSELLLVFQRD